eukprot:8766216-Pyramimonas_sp.AAC.1
MRLGTPRCHTFWRTHGARAVAPHGASPGATSSHGALCVLRGVPAPRGPDRFPGAVSRPGSASGGPGSRVRPPRM